MNGGEGFFDFPPDWKEHWEGMPAFCQADLPSWQSVMVHFRGPEDRDAFGRLIGRKLTDKTRSIWWPREEISSMADKRFISGKPHPPRWPVYVPSKGRWDTCHTVRSLDAVGVPYCVVVEPQEADAYAAAVGRDKLLILPHRDRGLVVTRNWIWDYARDVGVARFWTMDDNICGFYRLFDNIKIPVACGNFLTAMEQFAERYDNVPMLGMNYFMFASRKDVLPPFYLNTHVYSNMLIQTDARNPGGAPYRNEGDDTDMCLRVLKDGLCTVLFNAFLIFKSTTMSVEGGMTPHYQGNGRWEMAEELRKKYCSRFKRNRLKRRPGAFIPKGSCEFGMHLQIDDEGNDAESV